MLQNRKLLELNHWHLHNCTLTEPILLRLSIEIQQAMLEIDYQNLLFRIVILKFLYHDKHYKMMFW